MTQQHILIITIGPVQSFIAEARRTADLFAGSKILVELARAIVEAIVAEKGTLIYPLNSTGDIPNKMVAIVTEPENVAKAARAAMTQRWQDFGNKGMERLFDVHDNTLQKIWKQQFDSHLDFYWVAVPLSDDYIKDYKLADRALGARKQTRNFEQVIEDGFKDSLSGTRSALRRRQDKDARAYWAELRKIKKVGQLVHEDELLDTLGVIKRFGVVEKFPSTHTVASASFIKNSSVEARDKFIQAIDAYNEQVKTTPANIRLQDGADIAHENYNYQQKHGYFHEVDDFNRNFRYDGDLLYLEGYERLVERYGSEPPFNISPIKTALLNLYQAAKKRPSPYYAILQMDGDSMGKHVSQCEQRNEHEQLSKDLDTFTQKAKQIVIEQHGYLIYAGGDDVLAFFPVDCALNAAQALAQVYADCFKEWKQKDDKENDFPFTASIGIAFAHYLDPLDLVLRTAREAEKRAKNQYGRDAIAVTILRRSGETLEVGGKWEVATINTAEMVNQLKNLLETELISSRFPYTILRDAEVVAGLKCDGQKAILKQTLNRHSDKTSSLPDTLLNNWATWAKHQGYLELARWFVVARWLSAGGQE